MVTKESIKKAKQQQDKWIKETPDATLKTRVKKAVVATRDALEMETGLHTLPSLLVPMPEESAIALKRKIHKMRKLQ